MDASKRSDEDTVDSEMEATDEGVSSGADPGSGLRKRVTFDSDDQSDDGTGRRPQDSAPPPPSSSMGTALVLVTLAFVVFSSLGFYHNTSSHEDDVDPEWITEQLTKNVRIVRSKFPTQTKTMWADFYSGIQKVLMEKPSEPSVYLLIHDEGAKSTAACLARKVGGLVHALLAPVAPDYLVLDGGNAGLLAPEVYRTLVDRHRVVIVDDLQLTSKRSAVNLLPLCDVDSPLVDRAVYVLTLEAGGRGGDARGDAEAGLRELWAGLEAQTLSQLVRCVAGGHVFRVVAEKGMAEGC